MSMSIILSDQATSIMQSHLAQYGSAEDVIESALFRLHEDDMLDDHEYMEYLRKVIAEAEADQDPPESWNLDAIKQECHRQLEERHGV
ncbi:MAG: hypothetical protein H7839_12500 [Magnetococcus sp. YQC-5]